MIEVGEIVDGRFRIEALLGEGGLARVYKVRHIALGSVYALKLLSWQKQALAERLLMEGRIQAQLQHPNIVSVTDLVRHNGQFGLLMEYVDQESLEDFLDTHGGLGPEAGLEMFAQILAGVAVAHDAGVTHRDLKPANVLLKRSGRGLVPKVTDFGIAKVVAELAAGSTAVGTTMGTPGYLAPEQMKDSSAIDGRADVFALGAIGWELITGRRAFAEPDGSLTVMSTTNIHPPHASTLVSGVPAAVDHALARAMAKDPTERYGDCRSFARELFADRPNLLAVVEGQQRDVRPLSLSGVREVIEDSLSSDSGQPRPTGDSLTSGTILPILDEPKETRRPLWFVGVIALAGVCLVGGAIWWSTLTPVGPQSTIAAVPVIAPTPKVAVAPKVVIPLVAAPPVVEPPRPVAAPEPPRPKIRANPPPAAVSVAPAVVVPAPRVQPVVDDADPEEVKPEEPDLGAVTVEETTPEDIQVTKEPEPTSAAPDPTPEPPPEPTPEPEIVIPNIAGSWSGKANKRPFNLTLSMTSAGVLQGTVSFPGPTIRTERISGAVDSGGRVRFGTEDLLFSGAVAGETMQGTFRRGTGKVQVWSLHR